MKLPRLLLAGCALAGAAALRAEVQIERLLLPDAAPSSFAIGLPGGIGFCFDPVRGGLSYAWTGGFVDLTPARPGMGKFIAPAKLGGPVVHRETGAAPLRRGDPARVPAVVFSGYTLRADAIEFRYTVDGVAVREEIRARADGGALVRRIHVASDTDAKWWHVTDGRVATELKREADGAFVIEVPLSGGAK
ncbi:MAG: hypothetical protein Q8N18_08855 [Opitutaceae bacterium]|nr:hypothetical protein [Opitutaceae bacterium]